MSDAWPTNAERLALRLAVADHIEAHPELHDQSEWGDGSADPACGTACCVAGWACHLGGGSRGLPVPVAALRLLRVDGMGPVSFLSVARREEVLSQLRGDGPGNIEWADCVRCIRCSDCADCSDCSDCSTCVGCVECSYCYDCFDCCGVIGGMGLHDVRYPAQVIQEAMQALCGVAA